MCKKMEHQYTLHWSSLLCREMFPKRCVCHFNLCKKIYENKLSFHSQMTTSNVMENHTSILSQFNCKCKQMHNLSTHNVRAHTTRYASSPSKLNSCWRWTRKLTSSTLWTMMFINCVHATCKHTDAQHSDNSMKVFKFVNGDCMCLKFHSATDKPTPSTNHLHLAILPFKPSLSECRD